ncbi:MAG: type II CAAX prenyl endopeptidase Rce1 family protein, partial [Promethearchaeota archaeon]
MIKARKYVIIIITFIILTIPMYFGVYIEYFNIRDLNWLIIVITVFGFFILFILDKILVTFVYNRKVLEDIGENDVIKAFIDGYSKEIIWLYFPIIIITEELFFRYYTIGFFDYTLEFEPVIAIFLSSLFFSIYHIHIWFRYKNLIILLVNLGYP